MAVRLPTDFLFVLQERTAPLSVWTEMQASFAVWGAGERAGEKQPGGDGGGREMVSSIMVMPCGWSESQRKMDFPSRAGE